MSFAEDQAGDPHEAVHSHLVSVYQGQELPGYDTWVGEIALFTVAELREGVAQLKKGKAVGSDLTSMELILGIMGVEGGGTTPTIVVQRHSAHAAHTSEVE